MRWGPAVLVTAVALALVNLGLAALIVAAIGVASFVPWWIGGCAVALGVVAAVGAWRLWRQYLAASRDF